MLIKPKIIPEKSYNLVGCVFYGDPFHEAGNGLMKTKLANYGIDSWGFQEKIGNFLKKT